MTLDCGRVKPITTYIRENCELLMLYRNFADFLLEISHFYNWGYRGTPCPWPRACTKQMQSVHCVLNLFSRVSQLKSCRKWENCLTSFFENILYTFLCKALVTKCPLCSEFCFQESQLKSCLKWENCLASFLENILYTFPCKALVTRGCHMVMQKKAQN